MILAAARVQSGRRDPGVFKGSRRGTLIRNIKFGYELLERVPRDELRECFVTNDAIKISQLMRRMLGGT
jgi:hypothetical protein